MKEKDLRQGACAFCSELMTRNGYILIACFSSWPPLSIFKGALSLSLSESTLAEMSQREKVALATA